MNKGLATAAIKDALRLRFPSPEYAIVFEVGDSTGGRARRWADAVAMGCWPSRGLELHGIEVKASRYDWQKELRNPAKAENVFQYCDRWWIAAGDTSIVQPGELPPTWGLMVPNSKGLKIAVEAPKLEPKPVTRGFLASLLRKSVEQNVDDDLLRQSRAEGFKHGKESAEQSFNWERDKHNQLTEKVAAFEKASGLRIAHAWESGEKIGEAVRLVMNDEHTKLTERLQRLRKNVQSILAEIDQQLSPTQNGQPIPTADANDW